MKRPSKPSGAEFKKRRKEEEEKKAKYRDAMKKFLKPTAAAQAQPSPADDPGVGEHDTPSSSSVTADTQPVGTSSASLLPTDTEPADAGSGTSSASLQPEDTEPADAGTSSASLQPADTEPADADTGDTGPASSKGTTSTAPIDPGDWPAVSDAVRTEMVERGPYQVIGDFKFPKRKNGRSCHHHYFSRKLANGEKVKRSWLVYSHKKDRLYCFCCKLFSNKDFHLISSGLDDWKNCSDILRSHENSPEHARHMGAWRELESRLHKGQTIDKAEMALLEAERRKWRDILTRLVAIIQSLAERNIALRGTSEHLYERNNGNFLKEVELLAKFDPVLKQHVANVQRKETRTTYLGKETQNELIDCIGGKILQTMVSEVKRAKYFSIILDCTPDLSHTEQLSVITRIVDVEDSPVIKEHFMGFLEVESSTGESLSNLILKKLEELTIAFEDCRGQAYDNGANMKGKSKGVQARLLKMNPRALFVPCGAHTLNLVISDAAKSSLDATNFFGYLQRIFSLFSASTQRWDILKHHVTITVKSWSDTRWESRINAVQAVRFQSAEVRDALLEVRDHAKEPIIKTEAQSLAEEVGSYRFAICCVVWHDILSKVQHVSKLLQSVSMQVDVALNLIQTTEASLSTYRATGFVSAQVSARDVCEEMSVEAVLKQKRLRRMKRQFSYESPDQPQEDALKQLEASFFNVVVDVALSSLHERFQALSDVGEKFGVLTDFPNLTADQLTKQCEALGHTLSHAGQCDVEWRELAQEMENFPELPQTMNTLDLLTFLNEKKLKEVFPNLWVALRIAVTLPVTVASAERSFSRLKLIKTYLRSTMSQDRLNGLALISVNREVSSEISYDDTINEFATRKTRRVRF